MNFFLKLFNLGTFEKFNQAINEGNLQRVKLFYREEYLEKTNNDGIRPLSLACQNENLEIMKFLLEKNCLTDFIENGSSPFQIVYKNSNLEIVKYLLENNLGVESSDEFGMRPIHWACMNGDKEIIKLLIGHGCQLECKTYTGDSPYDIAINNYHLDCGDMIRIAIEILPIINRKAQIEIEKANLKLEKFNRSNKKICTICLDNEIDCVIECGHCFCMECGGKFTQCPYCRRISTNRRKIFLN